MILWPKLNYGEKCPFWMYRSNWEKVTRRKAPKILWVITAKSVWKIWPFFINTYLAVANTFLTKAKAKSRRQGTSNKS